MARASKYEAERFKKRVDQVAAQAQAHIALFESGRILSKEAARRYADHIIAMSDAAEIFGLGELDCYAQAAAHAIYDCIGGRFGEVERG